MVVGTAPGDYDTWARLVARHMRRYIPGNPPFVVENMPGAGSLIAANYLYNKAAQDGTVLGSVSRNIPNFAFTKKPNVFFDPLKYQWIGSPEITNRGCYARTDSGVEKPDDLFEHELLVGTDGAGTSLSEMPTLLKNLLGMKFKTIDGYQGSNGVVLAIAAQGSLGNLPDRHGVRAIGSEHARRRHGAASVHDGTPARAPPEGSDHFRIRQDRRGARLSSRSMRPVWRPADLGSRLPACRRPCRRTCAALSMPP